VSYQTPAGEMPVLVDVSIDVQPGQFVSLVGPSGCGKTTLLNVIAGLLVPSSGTVTLGSEELVFGSTPEGIGYMQARDALLPWRTALRNVELGLDIMGTPRAAKRERATALLDQVGLRGFEGYYRDQLSQGMRQRVALARTLACDPSLLLMDEPFAALDAQTRRRMETEFLGLLEASAKTVLFVTHDVVEAVSMSDVVVVFSRRPAHIKTVYELGARKRHSHDGPLAPELSDLYQAVWNDLDKD
jgi:NitT/TauT family transport system ATP-binding protein